MATKEQIKNTGATFTPTELSFFLANRLAFYVQASHQNILEVLDPACGEGELLVSMGNKLAEKGFNFSLSGYDANAQYLKYAKERMLELGVGKSDFVHADFLQAIDITPSQGTLDFFQEEKSAVNGRYDIVIANPPYVRTQILGTEQAQALAKKFNLKGRVDLYYPFLIAMTESLKIGGLLGVITSNRYLSTKSGASVRKFLSENYEILELIDLGDTKIFDAAVLPAIFIGRKNKQKIPSPAKFIKIYEELNGYKGEITQANSIYDILDNKKLGYFTTGSKRYKKSAGALRYSISSSASWEMLSAIESDWVSKIDTSSKNRVGDFFNVRVGIKSTADKIFISDKWEDLGDEKPENELLKPLIISVLGLVSAIRYLTSKVVRFKDSITISSLSGENLPKSTVCVS